MPPAFEQSRHRKRKQPPPIEELFYKFARHEAPPPPSPPPRHDEGDNDPQPVPSSKPYRIPSTPVDERVIIDHDDDDDYDYDDDDDDHDDCNGGVFVRLKDCYVTAKR